MKVRLFAILAVAAAATFGGFAHAGVVEPSSTCGSDATALPIPGVSIKATQGDTGGRLEVCNDGTTIPSPLKGKATLSAEVNQNDPASSSGSITVDGDSDNTAAPCTDGYVHADPSGFYESPDGNWDPAHPGTAEDLPTFLGNVINNCTGGAPSAPELPEVPAP